MIQLSSENGQGSWDRFRSYDTSIEALRSTVPTIHQALRPGTPLDRLEGWQAMVQRHNAFREQGGEPVLVATMFGPTGAGMSLWPQPPCAGFARGCTRFYSRPAYCASHLLRCGMLWTGKGAC